MFLSSLTFGRVIEVELQCARAATDVVHIFIDGLGTQTEYFRHGPEAQCVFVTFAAAFLIKVRILCLLNVAFMIPAHSFLRQLLHPKYATYLTMDQRKEIHSMVQVTIDILASPQVVNDDRHSPRLWSRFLQGLLATPMAKIELSPSALKGGHALPSRRSYTKKAQRAASAGAHTDAGRGSPSDPASPAPSSTAMSTSSLPACTPTEQYAASDAPSPNTAASAPSSGNALQMDFPEFFPMAFDNDFLQSMHSIEDTSIWQNMNMPGASRSLTRCCVFLWLTRGVLGGSVLDGSDTAGTGGRRHADGHGKPDGPRCPRRQRRARPDGPCHILVPGFTYFLG